MAPISTAINQGSKPDVSEAEIDEKHFRDNPHQYIQIETTVEVTSDAISDKGLSREQLPLPFPEGGLQAWLCVMGSFFLLMPSYGLMVSIGTIQEHWQSNQLKAYSSRDIGWISSLFVYLGLSLGVFVGPLFDRYGPRIPVSVGSGLYLVSIFTLAECSKYWQFMLCLGVLGGVSTALISTAALAVVSHWFERRRGTATGIALMGNAIGGAVIPQILVAMFPRYGWIWAIRIVGFFFLACLVIGNVFVKGRLTSRHGSDLESQTSNDDNASESDKSGKKAKKQLIAFRAFTSPAFSIFTVTVLLIEIVLFGSLGILPTYTSLQPNYPQPATGFYMISVLNACSALGRVIPGLVADYIGRFNTLLISIATTLIFMMSIWLPYGQDSLGALYTFIAIFGFGSGSWMVLAPVCVSQLCRTEEFGSYFGACYFVASLATLVTVPICGELLTSVGPTAVVGFFCLVLLAASGSLVMSRWAALNWCWRWRVKV